jgi:hypothetical protein
MFNITEANSKDDERIEKFLFKSPSAEFYHLPQWLEILEKESSQKGIKLICTDDSNNIAGYMPLLFTRGFPVYIGGVVASKRLASLPRTPIAGPVSEHPQVLKMLVEAAIGSIPSDKNCRMQIKYYSRNLEDLVKEIVCVPWRKTYYKEIPPKPEKILFENGRVEKEVKRAFRKAEVHDVHIRQGESVEDLKKWYKLYLETMRYHTTPPRSLSFFKNLWEGFYSKGLLNLTLVELGKYPNGMIINGTISFKYKDKMYGAFKGSSRKHFKYRANDLLHYYELNKAQEEGFRIFDFGEVQGGHEGLENYKKKWGGTEDEIFHYYLNTDHLDKEKLDPGNRNSIVTKVWRCLPLYIIEKMGIVINRQL